MHTFLERVSKSFELVLFTAASQAYADLIVDAIESDRVYFSHRLYRQHCREVTLYDANGLETGSYYVKELHAVRDRQIQDSLLLDDNGVHAQANPGRCLLIASFDGQISFEEEEKELQHALELLLSA